MNREKVLSIIEDALTGIAYVVNNSNIVPAPESDLTILQLSHDNLSTITAETPIEDVKAILSDINLGISPRLPIVQEYQTLFQMYQGIMQNFEVVLEEIAE